MGAVQAGSCECGAGWLGWVRLELGSAGVTRSGFLRARLRVARERWRVVVRVIAAKSGRVGAVPSGA